MHAPARQATRILVVDDDRPTLTLLANGLRRAGYLVTEALSGDEALRLALESNPEIGIALLDMRMPGMSGLDLAKALKEQTQVPFLFMSAHGEADIVRDATSYGALGYLVKPLEIAQVIPALEAALARAEEIKTLRESEAGLNIALARDRETSIAVGIIMERNRVDRKGAFELLRSSARSQRRKVGDLAEEYVNAAETINRLR